MPFVITGTYLQQLNWVVQFLKNVDLTKESVAFLKPKGGGWFDAIKHKLNQERISYVSLTRSTEWPKGSVNIALSTMHSAKGLEFDHVVILGLSEQVTPHGVDPEDSNLDNLRRLLAMALDEPEKP